MRKLLMGAAALALLAALPQGALAQDAMATPGKAVSMVLLPKFLGILPFDLAHQGAEEAAKELKNPIAAAVPGADAAKQRRWTD